MTNEIADENARATPAGETPALTIAELRPAW